MPTLTLNSDIDCNIFVDTEYHGIAKANKDYVIELSIGTYWIKCISTENENDYIDFDFRALVPTCCEYHKIELIPIRFSRIMSYYDSIAEFSCGFAEVSQDDKIVGYINHRGDFFDLKIFDNIIPYGENIAWAKKDHLWGILDYTGKYIIEPQFTAIELIESKLAIFFNGERYGIINQYGEIIVPAKYSCLCRINGTNLFYCTLNNKYGIINFDGDKITPLKYDSIKSFSDGYTQVKFNGLWGVINSLGAEIIPCQYDYIRGFSEDVAAVCVDYKWGYIDKTGHEIIPCQYEAVKLFSEGLAGVCINKKWGFIDKCGNLIIPYEYSDVRYFIDGVASVRTSQGEYLINKTGKMITTRMYQFSGDEWLGRQFIEGKQRVKINGKWGFIDKTGTEIIPCRFDDAQNFNEGRAAVKVNDKWGYIENSGELVIPCMYSSKEFYDSEEGHWKHISSNEPINSFKEGLAAVSENKAEYDNYPKQLYGYIDILGNKVIPFKYNIAKSFSNGLAAVNLNGKWGYIDKKDNIKIPFVFEFAEDFDKEIEGLARVMKGNKWGFINKSGDEIIRCLYDKIGTFHKGSGCIVKVKRDYRYGFINKMGDEIIPCKYNNATEFSQDFAAVVVNFNDKWGFIDKTGREVIPCTYENVENFGSGFEELSRVKLNNKYGLINKEGTEVAPCIYSEIWHPIQGRAAVCNIVKNGWGYIDKSGKETISCIYSDVGDFIDGLAWVRIGGDLGHYYHYGTNHYRGTLAKPIQGGKYGLINRLGEIVVPCIYDSIVYEGDCYRVQYGGEWRLQEPARDRISDYWVFCRGEIYYINKEGEKIAKETKTHWLLDF